MATQTEIERLVAGVVAGGACEIRGTGGRKLLVLSWRAKQGYRFYKMARSGGGGQKHTDCTPETARILVAEALNKPGARIMREK
jgi:hypothetical protein